MQKINLGLIGLTVEEVSKLVDGDGEGSDYTLDPQSAIYLKLSLTLHRVFPHRSVEGDVWLAKTLFILADNYAAEPGTLDVGLIIASHILLDRALHADCQESGDILHKIDALTLMLKEGWLDDHVDIEAWLKKLRAGVAHILFKRQPSPPELPPGEDPAYSKTRESVLNLIRG